MMMMMEPLEMDTKLAGGDSCLSTGPIAGRHKRSNREKETTTPLHVLYVPRRHGRASGRGRQSQLEMQAMDGVGVVGWLDGDNDERVGFMKEV
jgi:hypothetical protein